MWTYDLTNHLMVEVDTIIALTTMIYIVDRFFYGRHPMNKHICSDFTNDKQYACFGKSILDIIST